MTIGFKITRWLLQEIRADLSRQHKFARERVGFIAASLSSTKDDLWVLARGYRPVADDDYLNDPSVGAMMGPEAIRKAMQWAFDEHVAIFHIHKHGGRGLPHFSGVDRREQVKFVPTFFQTARKCPHGALVLSKDAAVGNIWLDPTGNSEPVDHFVEVGCPIRQWVTHEPL